MKGADIGLILHTFMVSGTSGRNLFIDRLSRLFNQVANKEESLFNRV